MNQAERWADIIGFEGRYQISDLGRVYNLRRRSFLRGTVSKSGYRQVKFITGNRVYFFYVHALVLSAFVGPRPEGDVIEHLNGTRDDNRVCNLEYVTPIESIRRAKLAGRFKRNYLCGEAHHLTVLTKEQVEQIRIRHQNGSIVSELAKDFKVTPSTIRHVVKRETWKHVE